MKLKVENDDLKYIEESTIRAKTINIYEIELEFSPDWDELTKTIVYMYGSDVWQEPIVNNKTIVPSLPSGKEYAIGVVGTAIENDIVVKRKATNWIYHAITTSSAEVEQNQYDEDEIAKTYEKYMQSITAESLKIQGYLGNIEELAEQIEKDKQEIEIKVKEFNKIAEEKSKDISDSADAVTDILTSMNLVSFYVDKNMKCHAVSQSELINNKFYIKNGKLGVKTYVNR